MVITMIDELTEFIQDRISNELILKNLSEHNTGRLSAFWEIYMKILLIENAPKPERKIKRGKPLPPPKDMVDLFENNESFYHGQDVVNKILDEKEEKTCATCKFENSKFSIFKCGDECGEDEESNWVKKE